MRTPVNISFHAAWILGLCNIASAATLDVTTFGAVAGDGLSDQAAFVAAINASQSGDTISIPAGTFVTTAFLSPKNGTRLIGAGKDATIIEFRYQGSGHKEVFRIRGAGTSDNIELAEFTVDGLDGQYVHADSAIQIVEGSGVKLRNLRIKDFPAANSTHYQIGVRINASTNCTVEGCEILNIGVTSLWGGRDSVLMGKHSHPNRREHDFQYRTRWHSFR